MLAWPDNPVFVLEPVLRYDFRQRTPPYGHSTSEAAMTKIPRIAFLLNGQEISATAHPGQTALDLLRALGRTSAKEGCNEGDCGACTVLIGEIRGSQMHHDAVNACLVPAPRLHGRHVLTVEGLGDADNLHPIQQAMLDAHAVQCGFCTPGQIMSLLGLFAATPQPSDEDIASALEGNLCRCTGYTAIRDAALALRQSGLDPDRVLPDCCLGEARRLAALPPLAWEDGPTETGAPIQHYHRPQSLDELFALLAGLDENVRILAGGTDIQVEANLKHVHARHLVDLDALRELRFIREQDGLVRIGAMATLSDVLSSDLIRARLPLLARAVSQMASAQIRNRATLAGNMATASPIGDGSTALLALSAVLVLRGPDGERRLPLEQFFLGYRRTALGPREIITALEVPPQTGLWDWRKSARRAAVDIAAVSSALCAGADGQNPRLSCAGVAATPVLLRQTMALLSGRALTPELIREASLLASSEIAPISDVRGGADYRRLLVRNHVAHHLAVLSGQAPRELVPLLPQPTGDAS